MRREAIAGEGAEVVVVDGTYEDAVAAAAEAAARARRVDLIADVGESGPAHWVIDGYATLFAEAGAAGRVRPDPRSRRVGALAAAAARHGAAAGVPVVGVEPATAACLTASLAAGTPTAVATPGTTMAGLDCAEVSTAAWPTLRHGIHGMVTVSDAETHAAMRSLAAARPHHRRLRRRNAGGAPRARDREAGRALCGRAGLGRETRVLLVATEGATDPDGYRRVVNGTG